jgi:hypothetical protein
LSYASLIELEGIKANYLVLLKPRRKVAGFAVFSGSVYSVAFTLGQVTSVTINGVDLTLGSSTSLSAGQFYYASNVLYVRTSGSTDPAADIVVATYEFYTATFDAHWYRTPTDSTTETVYWEPLVAQVPQIRQSVKEIAFGVIPTQSSSIVLNNAEKILNEHLYYSSFNRAEIYVYHWLNTLSVDNIKLVYRGRMGNHTWTDSRVNIQTYDSIDLFDTEFRPDQALQFYSSSDYPSLDTNFEGKPIRYAYGIVNGFVPVNVDYNDDEPTTGDNRVWKVACEGSTFYTKTATVVASPSSTTTRTYVDSVAGLSVGDSVRIDKATDETRPITLVDYGSNYIEHLALSSGAAASGDTVIRYPVGRVDIVQQGQAFAPQVISDYSTSVDASGVLTLTFESTLEANQSMPATLSPTDTIFCRVYGKQNDVTLSGGALGSNDTSGGNLQNAGVILVDLLKRYADVDEDDLNIADFQALAVDADDRLGFAIPERSGDAFPKMKKLIEGICQTSLTSFFQDSDLLWTAKRLKPIADISGEIEDDEILANSLNYSFSYGDIYSDVVVQFANQEKSVKGVSEGFSLERAQSTTAKYVHKVDKTLEVDSLHYNRSDAARLALRLSHLYGERQGEVSLNTKNRFFEFEIDEILRVSRASLPGFAYNEDTERSLDLNMREGTKDLRKVSLVLNDLKGVTDNSGDF